MSKQTPQSDQPHSGILEVQRLNDWLRHHITQPGGNHVVMTSGVADLIGDMTLFRNFRKRAELLRAVRDYDDFSVANDPYGEHDLGTFDFEGAVCMWKIDYYDTDLSAGSENPADPSVTVRVLTIMRADER